MPWLLSSPLDCASPSPCQRQCERTAFSFYCAVRERLPAWLLEDMRGMEVFCWDDGRPRAFRPSEALLYALVHDHQDYARFLLDTYSVGALRAPRCSFCRSRGGAPHLAVAVRYDRVAILGMMVDALRDRAEPGERRRYLDGGGACAHAADAGKSAVQLAVELSRPRCLLLLLARGGGRAPRRLRRGAAAARGLRAGGARARAALRGLPAAVPGRAARAALPARGAAALAGPAGEPGVRLAAGGVPAPPAAAGPPLPGPVRPGPAQLPAGVPAAAPRPVTASVALETAAKGAGVL